MWSGAAVFGPSSGMMSCDLWAWPRWSLKTCHVTCGHGHAHRSRDRSHGTPTTAPPSSHCIIIVPITPYLLSVQNKVPSVSSNFYMPGPSHVFLQVVGKWLIQSPLWPPCVVFLGKFLQVASHFVIT